MTSAGGPIRGLIFDLDGTLVDSRLDFEAIRRDLGLAPRTPILEAFKHLPPQQAERCWQILAEHEQAGVERSLPMPGVKPFLNKLRGRSIRQAVFTRNSRAATLESLARHGLQVEVVVAREDAPPKPDPTGIARVYQMWGLSPRQVAMVGDYRFDLEAGRNGGVWTVLYAAGRKPADYSDFPAADFVLESFEEPEEFLAWLDSPGCRLRG